MTTQAVGALSESFRGGVIGISSSWRARWPRVRFLLAGLARLSFFNWSGRSDKGQSSDITSSGSSRRDRLGRLLVLSHPGWGFATDFADPLSGTRRI